MVGLEADITPYVTANHDLTGARQLLIDILGDVYHILTQNPRTLSHTIQWVLDYNWVYGSPLDPTDTWYFTFEQITMYLQRDPEWIREDLRARGATMTCYRGILYRIPRILELFPSLDLRETPKEMSYDMAIAAS